MVFKEMITSAMELALNPRGIYALLTWPIFSMTSYRMVSAIKKQGINPKTVIDVGANVGQFAIAMAKLIPNIQIHSFEPLPEAMALLKKHVRNLQNILVYPVALGDNEGQASFYVNADSRSSSFLPMVSAHRTAFPHAQEVRTIQVKTSTLDKVFVNNSIESPILLKIDVQGYEENVLRGGLETLKRVDYVILEASFKPLYQGEALFLDMIQLMNDNSFKFLRPIGWLKHPKTEALLQADILFARKQKSKSC
jgi:FkbM family methyltransferase